MNPDLPHNSREELEASLTALLLGELPPEQAAELRRAIEQDAALEALCQRLKLTIDLVRETALQPAEQTAAPPVLLRLSDRRRQELLAHFKTVTPKEFARPRRQEWQSPVLVAAAAVLVGLLALAMFLPAVTHSRSRLFAWGSASGAAPEARGLESGVRLADLERLRRGGQPAPAPAQTAKNAKNAKTENLSRGRVALAQAEKRLMEGLAFAEVGGRRAGEVSARLAERGVGSLNRGLKFDLAAPGGTGALLAKSN